MTPLQLPKFPWKKLDAVLKMIETAINANCPQRSDTILIEETPSGAIISVAPTGRGDPSSPASADTSGGGGGDADDTLPDGTPAAWQQIQVIDASCNTLTMWVWGSTPT